MKRSHAMQHITLPSRSRPTMRMIARAGGYERQSQNPSPQADPRIFCRRFAPLTPPRGRAVSMALAGNVKEVVMSAATVIALLIPLTAGAAASRITSPYRSGIFACRRRRLAKRHLGRQAAAASSEPQRPAAGGSERSPKIDRASLDGDFRGKRSLLCRICDQ